VLAGKAAVNYSSAKTSEMNTGKQKREKGRLTQLQEDKVFTLRPINYMMRFDESGYQNDTELLSNFS
jgi:hypothetical protein